jgi:hypothetical protein
MHYAVARILHGARRLECLFTDVCATKGWPSLLRRCLPPSLRPPPVARMLSRVPDGLPADRIRAFAGLGVAYALRRAAEARRAEVNPTDLWAARAFAARVRRNGLGSASALYTFNQAALELLVLARERGLRTVLEQTSPPLAMEARIVSEEAAAFPGWEDFDHDQDWLEAVAQRERDEWNMADMIVCGSAFVRDTLAGEAPLPRCVVVPYGVDAGRGAPVREARGGALRVLTTGIVGLRKGSPYVQAAARALRGAAEFRMVGAAPLKPHALASLRRDVDLVGAMARPEVARHYAWADVFLLPSLCEGSATACYEALASGLPVIATFNAGSVVRDGIDGFVVPLRDVDAIVEKLTLLATDRARLREMSARARERGLEFDLAGYGGRLLNALDGRDGAAGAA